MRGMAVGSPVRTERRAREHNATRASILEAARRVAARDGARNLSLRATAAEAGFAPAALYGYFQNKNDLLLALAADDLSGLARAMRSAAGTQEGPGRLAAAAGAALSLLQGSETFAAAPSALPPSLGTSDAERLFNGRMIAALNALSDATGQRAESRQSQADVLLLAASLTGLALLARSGRLSALGFSAEELLVRLDARFTNSI
jgi:AcrR family transcriptional regulator